jgi:phage terminase large subunit-like protein
MNKLREKQKPPDGKWKYWVLMGGRGAGKNYAGAKWVLSHCQSESKPVVIGIVGQDVHNVKDIMLGCPKSGILSLYNDTPKKDNINNAHKFPNGTSVLCFNEEKNHNLRGVKLDIVWIDNIEKFEKPLETFNLLKRTRFNKMLITLTPNLDKKSSLFSLINNLTNREDTVVRSISSLSNKDNLDADFLENLVDEYQGTKLYNPLVKGKLMR